MHLCHVFVTSQQLYIYIKNERWCILCLTVPDLYRYVSRKDVCMKKRWKGEPVEASNLAHLQL